MGRKINKYTSAESAENIELVGYDRILKEMRRIDAESLAGFDLVIRTQQEFEDMIDSTHPHPNAPEYLPPVHDWKGAKTVAILGEFEVPYGKSMINDFEYGEQIPPNVKYIEGFGIGKIEGLCRGDGGLFTARNMTIKGMTFVGTGGVEEFAYGVDGDDCVFIDCKVYGKTDTEFQTTLYGYGFQTTHSTLINCYASGVIPDEFSAGGQCTCYTGNSNSYISCKAELLHETGVNMSLRGFTTNHSKLVNCSAIIGNQSGDDNANAIGFKCDYSQLENCYGEGRCNYHGYGIMVWNSSLTNCEGFAQAGVMSTGIKSVNSVLTTCRAKGSGYTQDRGFSGDDSVYNACIGSGDSNNRAMGYIGNRNIYSHCIGAAYGAVRGEAFNIYGSSADDFAVLIGCIVYKKPESSHGVPGTTIKLMSPQYVVKGCTLFDDAKNDSGTLTNNPGSNKYYSENIITAIPRP